VNPDKPPACATDEFRTPTLLKVQEIGTKRTAIANELVGAMANRVVAVASAIYENRRLSDDGARGPRGCRLHLPRQTA
jgi:hypothetical protein